MHLEQAENQQQSAFRTGLRDALTACIQVLLSPSYVGYLRQAIQEKHDDIATLAVRSGHDAMVALLANFLAEAAAHNLVPPQDFAATAQSLLAQAQGNDFVHAITGTSPDPEQVGRRTEKVVAEFCRTRR